LADNAVITPIQIGMIIALAKVFDRRKTLRGLIRKSFMLYLMRWDMNSGIAG